MEMNGALNGASEGVDDSAYRKARKKLIDDTDISARLDELKKVSPWIPQFTPEAPAPVMKAPPPKRPPSPFSGAPLRSKDLISVQLVKEDSKDCSSSVVKYICPVSRSLSINITYMIFTY